MKKLPLVTMLLCFASSVPVLANAPVKSEIRNIKTQRSPYYQSPGARLSTFIVRPSLSLMQEYDNNIFREPEAESDHITSVRPALTVQSDWELHSLGAGVNADFGRYSEFDSEDYDDFSFYVSGRYDVDYGTYFTTKLQYDKRHQERDAIDDQNGDEPTEYALKSVFVGFTRDLSVLRLYTTAEYRDFDYDDNERDGVQIDNSIRNRAQQDYTVRLGYGLSDNFEVYTQAGYNKRRYDVTSATRRNSDGYDLRVGFTTDITGKIRSDVFAGYLLQDYESNFDDVSAANFGASVLWNVTPLTSVEFDVERTLEETIQEEASTVVRTVANAEIHHYLRENIMLNGRLGFTDDTYEDEDRSDNDNQIYRLGLGVQYWPNQNLNTGLRYDYFDRVFDDSARDYDNSRVRLTLGYTY